MIVLGVLTGGRKGRSKQTGIESFTPSKIVPHPRFRVVACRSFIRKQDRDVCKCFENVLVEHFDV